MMRPWETGTAEIATEKIHADSGPTPVRFNRNSVDVIDGPVHFRRTDWNDLLAAEVVKAAAVSHLLQPFTAMDNMTQAARSSLIGAAATFIASGQKLSLPEDRDRHFAFGQERFRDIAGRLEAHEGRIGVTVVRIQLKRF